MPEKKTIPQHVIDRAREVQEENLERFEQVYGRRPYPHGPKSAEAKRNGTGTAKPKQPQTQRGKVAKAGFDFDAWRRNLPPMGNGLTNPTMMTPEEQAGVDSRLAEMTRRDRKASFSTVENMKKLIAPGYR